MTVIRGAVYKVFPSTVEQIINQHADVLESCIVQTKRGADHLLKAYIVKAKDADEKQLISDLKAACEQKLAENAQPVEYEVIVDMPRTAAGKIDYRALEERATKEV